jgi:hypothetical protein
LPAELEENVMLGCRSGLAVRALFFSLAVSSLSVGCAASQPAHDIPVLVMEADGDPASLASTNSAARAIGTKIKEQFERYNYDVVDENAVAAAFGFDFSRRMDSAGVLNAAMQAKKSGRAEFDVRGVVIYKVYAQVHDFGFAKQFSLDIAGEVHDLESGLYLGDFGPISRSFPASADCVDNSCVNAVLRDHGVDIAAIVADEARKKLALLTKPEVAGGDAPVAPVVAVADTADALHAPVVPERRLIVAFENVRMNDVLKIKGVMESEFPDFVRAGHISGSDPIVQYGYVSRAPQDKMFEWVNILISDMGMKHAKIMADGNTITVKNLASDMPVQSGQAPKFH